jgi:hypothetical protein
MKGVEKVAIAQEKANDLGPPLQDPARLSVGAET